MSISDRLKHFFHVVSNIRPIVWIGIYVAITPVFALIYMALPDGQFRIPDGGTTDFGSWLYYSIVTITTLGFGDYTPAHGWAQAVTAVEVMCGLIFLGFFLNAVGSMKSEIDITTEKEKQKLLHESAERDKFIKAVPAIMHSLNTFLSYCYALTTPLNQRNDEEAKYNPDFTFNDMYDLYKPSGLPVDNTRLPVVTRVIKSMHHSTLLLDSLQSNVDLTIWPEILEDAFKFVAESQMFDSEDALLEKPAVLFGNDDKISDAEAEQKISDEIRNWTGALDFKNNKELQPIADLYYLIKENAALAISLQNKIIQLM